MIEEDSELTALLPSKEWRDTLLPVLKQQVTNRRFCLSLSHTHTSFSFPRFLLSSVDSLFLFSSVVCSSTLTFLLFVVHHSLFCMCVPGLLVGGYACKVTGWLLGRREKLEFDSKSSYPLPCYFKVLFVDTKRSPILHFRFVFDAHYLFQYWIDSFCLEWLLAICWCQQRSQHSSWPKVNICCPEICSAWRCSCCHLWPRPLSSKNFCRWHCFLWRRNLEC